MSSRLLISVFIVVSMICSASALYAQDAPQPDPAVDAQVADAFAQATNADKAKHPDQAAQILWSIVDRFPNHRESPRAAKQAAYATDKLKDRDKSIVAFKRALEAYPNSEYAPALKRGLALSYQAKGDKDSAIRELEDLVARFPKSDPASYGLVNLGLLYVSQVDKQNSDAVNWQLKEAADLAFKQAVELFPTNRDLCAMAEMYRSGIAFERALAKRMSWDDAIKQVQDVKDAYPGADPGILARLELMQAEKAQLQGNNADCAERMELVIRSYPTCKLEVGWAHYVCACAYELLGDYRRVLEHCRAVIDGEYTERENFKGRDIVLYCLMKSADSYVQLGDKVKACRTWRSVLSRYPNDPCAKLAKSRLEKYEGRN
jgi:tetratricopeptide (TPR) repeat protein